MTGEEQYLFQRFNEVDGELQRAEQLINGILKTLNLEAYDYRADQNEILTEIRAFKQECEELKEKLAAQENINNHIADYQVTTSKTLDHYRKAIEEIEKVCIEDTREFADGTTVRYDALDKILDIINKAKGEGNE